MLFTFAGSGHSNYSSYITEMVCAIELESSEPLREAMLQSLLVNLSCVDGKWLPADIVQELFNRYLEPLIQRKDTDFGSWLLRQMYSRNVKDIYELHAQIRESLGLSKRSAHHTDPHQRPEVKTLLASYKKTQLHKRRPGRIIDEGRNVDNMERGIELLVGGGLQKWVNRSVRSRECNSAPSDGHEQEEFHDEHEENEGEEEGTDIDMETETEPRMTFGTMHDIDGEIIIDFDEDQMDAQLAAALAEEDEEYFGDEDE